MRIILGQGTSTIFKATYHGQIVAVKECSSDNTAKFETEVKYNIIGGNIYILYETRYNKTEV
jgi:hypothetical protein